MKNINVTKSYLPPLNEYVDTISKIWDNHFLTNYGPLNNSLVEELEKYLELKNIHFVNNGTISLHLCMECLGIENAEIITTPFTFVATISSIIWQKNTPIFVDINPNDFNIDVEKIEEKITSKTKAILAVHCFGYPCNVKRIKEIAVKHNLFVIYDAAHSFGSKLDGKSMLSYGDISSCSLHATKVFHSIEGGLCVVNNEKYNKKMNAIKNFGNSDGQYEYVGINAKNSEFHAAMGLCVLNHFDDILEKRKKNYELYYSKLNEYLYIYKLPENYSHNYIYFPVLFDSEESLLDVCEALENENIHARRYFYPAINDVKLYKNAHITPIASDISKRIACLPLDSYLKEEEINFICDIIIERLGSKNEN